MPTLTARTGGGQHGAEVGAGGQQGMEVRMCKCALLGVILSVAVYECCCGSVLHCVLSTVACWRVSVKVRKQLHDHHSVVIIVIMTTAIDVASAICTL